MNKYVVESGLVKQSGIEEYDVLGIFSNYKDADEYALCKSELYDDKYIRVGEVSEEDLTVHGDWASYNQIDILNEY
ncbi:hypothetical protein [Butyrivibrio sp. MB2005]|uniref:hypothetical protein n=1 Tax=Butyrivibrio sp. MB2005 TaxID=1280678 RepID=UPI0003FF2068|nr:hypothetical protein [Butyrivibrio sp. MB2005]